MNAGQPKDYRVNHNLSGSVTVQWSVSPTSATLTRDTNDPTLAHFSTNTDGLYVITSLVQGASQQATAQLTVSVSPTAAPNSVLQIVAGSINLDQNIVPSQRANLSFSVHTSNRSAALKYSIRLSNVQTGTTFFGVTNIPAQASDPNGAPIGTGQLDYNVSHQFIMPDSSGGQQFSLIITVMDNLGSPVPSTPISFNVVTRDLMFVVRGITGPTTNLVTDQWYSYSLDWYDPDNNDSPKLTQVNAYGAVQINSSTTFSVKWPTPTDTNSTTGYSITATFTGSNNIQNYTYTPISLTGLRVARSCASNPGHTIYATVTSTGDTFGAPPCFTITIKAPNRDIVNTGVIGNPNFCGSVVPCTNDGGTHGRYCQATQVIGTIRGDQIPSIGGNATVTVQASNSNTAGYHWDTTYSYVDNTSGAKPPSGLQTWSPRLDNPTCQ